MGNKTTREPLKGLQEKNLSEAEQTQLEQLFFNVADHKKFKAEFDKFTQDHCSGLDLKTMFTVCNQFMPKDGEELNEDQLLLKQVIQKATYGFSSSEYKLNELKEGRKYPRLIYPTPTGSRIFEVEILILA